MLIYGWASSLGSYYDCRTHFSKEPLGNFEDKIYCSQILEGICHSQGHTARSQVEREHGLALPLVGSNGGMSRVLWVYFLLANLKHKCRNQGSGREK